MTIIAIISIILLVAWVVGTIAILWGMQGFYDDALKVVVLAVFWPPLLFIGVIVSLWQVWRMGRRRVRPQKPIDRQNF